MKNNLSIIPVEIIENKIYVIRGVKIIFDFDIAKLYQVKTKVLVQAVKRNKERFPEDFMFQLKKEEIDQMNRSQFVTGSQKHRDPKSKPYAFTEQGVAMLASVLKSKRAVEVSIAIVRAFIQLREMLQNHKDILVEIEKIKKDVKKQDEKILAIMNAINRMLEPELDKKKKKIGFRTK